MTRTTLLYFFMLAISLKTVYSIHCYQCSGTDSENPFDCNEYLEGDTDLQPTDCSTIHDAQHCIKYVGRYEGMAIDCYQCNSSTTMECGDGLINLDGGVLKATSCEHVYNAQYCIKQIGLTNNMVKATNCHHIKNYYGSVARGEIMAKVELVPKDTAHLWTLEITATMFTKLAISWSTELVSTLVVLMGVIQQLA